MQDMNPHYFFIFPYFVTVVIPEEGLHFKLDNLYYFITSNPIN